MVEAIYHYYKDFKIVVNHDLYPTDPRDWDNLGKMVCWHRRYRLGDKHSFDTPEDAMKYIKRTKSIWFPLYLYDHSGLVMNTSGFSCPWDSGQVGYIYVEPDVVREHFGWKRISKKRRKFVESILIAEVKEYSAYLEGDVYSCSITTVDGDELDVIFYYGMSIDEIVSDAKKMVDMNYANAG